MEMWNKTIEYFSISLEMQSNSNCVLMTTKASQALSLFLVVCMAQLNEYHQALDRVAYQMCLKLFTEEHASVELLRKKHQSSQIKNISLCISL